MESVTWYDAVEFCNTLSTREGLTPVYTLNNVTRTSSSSGGSGSVSKITAATVSVDWTKNGYRLPTSTEWESVTIGGANGKAPGGGYQRYLYPGSDTAATVAWFSGNSNGKTHEVGKRASYDSKYDLCGNVREWCWDYLAAYTSEAKVNPTGPTSGTTRVVRNGSFDTIAGWSLYNTVRGGLSPGAYDRYTGFRVARNAQ